MEQYKTQVEEAQHKWSLSEKSLTADAQKLNKKLAKEKELRSEANETLSELNAKVMGIEEKYANELSSCKEHCRRLEDELATAKQKYEKSIKMV